MEINYYTKREEAGDACEFCHGSCNPPKLIKYHIGASRAGRRFALNVKQPYGLLNWEQLKLYLKLSHNLGGWIEDEYGNNVTLAEMIKIVEDRSWEGKE